MSIGEVLAHLRPDFPDTTISKLRFLEAEGLVEPERTPAGYRKYSWEDVARLRYVLTAQRDHYLPLRVIREQLAAAQTGEASAFGRPRPVLVPSGPASDGRAAVGHATGGTAAGDVADGAEPVAGDGTGGVWLTRQQLLAHAGVTEELLADLEQHGLVAARAGGRFDADALAVATVAAQLSEYGLTARHLRAYRTAADREVGLFSQVVAPLLRQSDPAARARAAETVRELGELSRRLHATLVRAGLRDTLKD
ncbi:MAG TPA: MerR family transcriptional regulator [Micromonosporaceae bacterium]|nr:MerR family transcriptional regulator [Micromonosporaceae bacterium]